MSQKLKMCTLTGSILSSVLRHEVFLVNSSSGVSAQNSSRFSCMSLLSGKAPYSTSTDGPGDHKAYERLFELISNNQQLQQIMLPMMPPAMRNPAAFQAMVNNPDIRERLTKLLAEQNVIPPAMLQSFSAEQMTQAFTATAKSGLNPTHLMTRLMQEPALMARMREPRCMRAVMEVMYTPTAEAKYKDDPEIYEVIKRVQELLKDPMFEAAEGSDASTAPRTPELSSSSTEASTSGPAPLAVPQSSYPMQDPFSSLGQPPPGMPGMGALMDMIQKNPELYTKMAKPEVQKAIQDIAQNPVRIAKYLFDKDVMDVIKALRSLHKPL